MAAERTGCVYGGCRVKLAVRCYEGTELRILFILDSRHVICLKTLLMKTCMEALIFLCSVCTFLMVIAVWR